MLVKTTLQEPRRARQTPRPLQWTLAGHQTRSGRLRCMRQTHPERGTDKLANLPEGGSIYWWQVHRP